MLVDEGILCLQLVFDGSVWQEYVLIDKGCVLQMVLVVFFQWVDDYLFDFDELVIWFIDCQQCQFLCKLVLQVVDGCELVLVDIIIVILLNN